MPHRLLICIALFLGLGCDPKSEQVPAAQEAAQAPAEPQDLRERHGAMFKELRAMVKELQESGRYDCCIETPCSHCAMMVGGCSCGEGLRRGEPVCEECALMWIRGLGAETGVDPKTVRSFLEAERIINAKAAKSAAKHSMKHGMKHKKQPAKAGKRHGAHGKH